MDFQCQKLIPLVIKEEEAQSPKHTTWKKKNAEDKWYVGDILFYINNAGDIFLSMRNRNTFLFDLPQYLKI